MAETQRSIGTVKWFSGQKGFGFIAPDGGGEDLFVHQTEIHSEGFRTLREGQRVEFAVDYGEDGRVKAVDVVALAGSYRFGSGRGRGTARRGGRGSYGRYGDGYGGAYGRGRGRGGGYGSAVECYNCGRMGHLARDCYRGGGSGGGNWGYGSGGGRGGRGYSGGGGGRGYGGGGGGGGGGGLCYRCGEEGHFARDCPN